LHTFATEVAPTYVGIRELHDFAAEVAPAYAWDQHRDFVLNIKTLIYSFSAIWLQQRTRLEG
jgi:hypothetical protein